MNQPSADRSSVGKVLVSDRPGRYHRSKSCIDDENFWQLSISELAQLLQ